MPREAVIERPHFANRFIHLAGHRAIKRNHGYFWNLQDWKTYIDRALKRRMNVMILRPYDVSMPAARQAFPNAQWKRDPNFPQEQLEHQTKLMQEVLAYGRERGFRFMYNVSFGFVPADVQKAYPELGKTIAGSEVALPTTDRIQTSVSELAACRAYVDEVWKKVLELFGTDHLYLVGFASESWELAEYQSTVINAGVETVKSFDPKALAFIETWVQSYLAVPEAGADVHVLDNHGCWGRYQEMDYFSGRPWNWVIITAGCNTERLHGEMRWWVDRAREIATDPRASKCEGFGSYSEIVNYNNLHETLISELAWDPERVSLDTFVSDYARRRYGTRSAPNMTRSIRLLVEVLDSAKFPHDPNDPVTYNDPYVYTIIPQYRNSELFSYSSVAKLWKFYDPDWERVERLRRALDYALAEQRRQRDNPLYEEYLTALFEFYAAIELYKFPLIRLHSSYAQAAQLLAQGKPAEAEPYLQRFDRSRKALDTIYEWVGLVFSTRPDRWLGETVKEATAVPGSSPGTAELIRRWSQWTYNGTVEQVALVYHPEFTTIASDMWERLSTGKRLYIESETKRGFGDFLAGHVVPYDRSLEPKLHEELRAIDEQFVSGHYEDEAVPRFPGTTIEAVVGALDALERAGFTEYSDMHTLAEIETNYPFPQLPGTAE